MAGMSRSEYARHKQQQEQSGGILWRILGFTALIIFIPSLVIPLIGLMVIFGVLSAAIGDGLIKEDRY